MSGSHGDQETWPWINPNDGERRQTADKRSNANSRGRNHAYRIDRSVIALAPTSPSTGVGAARGAQSGQFDD